MLTLSTLAKNIAGKAITDLIDKASTTEGGYIEIRSGARPATPEATAAGTNLLATLGFSLPSFGSFNNGIALANSITSDTNIDKTGTATWFRIYDKNGIAIIDGDVKQTGSGGDIEFDNVYFIAGGTAQISRLAVNLFNNKCP